MDGASLIDSGMAFYMTGDGWEKAHWPIVKLVWGTVKRSWLLDCRTLVWRG